MCSPSTGFASSPLCLSSRFPFPWPFLPFPSLPLAISAALLCLQALPSELQQAWRQLAERAIAMFTHLEMPARDVHCKGHVATLEAVGTHACFGSRLHGGHELRPSTHRVHGNEQMLTQQHLLQARRNCRERSNRTTYGCGFGLGASACGCQ